MNYVFFIIDSLNYSHLKESTVELMPFLESLKREGMYCDTVFSQAPYTEAAVMNLYCGQDVLQDNGYLFRFKNAKTTLFEEMKKAGYITYYNSYQPQCHPSSVRRGVDYLYYNVGYDQGALWSYRIGHYSEQYKLGNLTEKDYCSLEEIFDDNFTEWIRFIDDLINNDESTNMIKDNAPNYDPSKTKTLVQAEFDLYLKNKRKYIERVLIEGRTHNLFKLPAYVQDGKIKDRTKVKDIEELFTPLLHRIQSMDTRLNLRNCKGLFKGPLHKLGNLILHPNKAYYKEFLKSGYLVVNELKDLDLFQRVGERGDSFKNAPSARTHVDHYLQWANEHKDEGKHFACIHVDDVHNPEVFFTYDTVDMDLLRHEKQEAELVLDQIPKTYYGSLTHDLSLRYIDNVLKYFYERLDQKGLLENTCVAVCADHGFSFSGNPLRDSFVINLFLENYNIPCVFTGKNVPNKQVKYMRTSKDIPATICDLAIGEVPEVFSGHSLLEEYGYPVVHIEYCGGGCPDLTRRELKLAAFTKEYFVGTLCTLQDKLEENAITEIYDLVNDPMQLNNIRHKKYDKKQVQFLLSEIEKRREEIRKSML